MLDYWRVKKWLKRQKLSGATQQSIVSGVVKMDACIVLPVP